MVTISSGGHRWGLGGGFLTCLSNQPLFYSLEPPGRSMRLGRSDLSRKRLMVSTIVGGDTTITARGDRHFAPRLGLLVPSLTECRYLPEILWLYCLPVHIRVLQIAGLCRNGLGGTCSWLICISRRCWLGMMRRPNYTCRIAPFVPCVQTRGHGHAVASLYSTSFDFW